MLFAGGRKCCPHPRLERLEGWNTLDSVLGLLWTGLRDQSVGSRQGRRTVEGVDGRDMDGICSLAIDLLLFIDQILDSPRLDEIGDSHRLFMQRR